jgi:hypothetical protein
MEVRLHEEVRLVVTLDKKTAKRRPFVEVIRETCEKFVIKCGLSGR